MDSCLLTEQESKHLKQLDTEGKAYNWAALKRCIIQHDPFVLIEEGHLQIKTKAGELVPLVLNKSQRRLFEKVKELWNAKKIIRIIILKARQLGISTLVEALLYSITSQVPNQNSLIIAHDKDGSDYLFEMSKLYQEKLEPYFRPETKKSNEKKLEFEGTHSQILIETAENKEAGRSLTLRCVHLSEYAFFRLVNANLIMLGLSHSVPTLPKTIMIKESTANGFNHFKDDWDNAVSGKTDEVAIFIPYYWGEEYMMDVPDSFVLGDPSLGDITKDEVELYNQMKEEGIDQIEERLQWRRYDIKNNCKGDVDKFRQENPSTPEEAFIASGACYFSQKQLVKQLKSARKPLFKANIVKENYKFILRKTVDGDFDFFEEPSKYEQYVIGGDAASGSGQDWSCLVVRNKGTNKVAAVYHAKADPDELAHKAMFLGSLFNECVVAIETDKFGFAANEKLRTIYGSVYVQRTFNKVENKIIEKIGWDTTSVSRPLMLGQMQEEIREGSLDLMDERIMRECLTFIKNPQSKKAEAIEGTNDDLVIACAIAGQIRHDSPYEIKPERKRNMNRTEQPRNAGFAFKRKR